MLRFVSVVMLAFVFAATKAVPAHAQLSRQDTCVETSKIVRIASTLRASGNNKATVQHTLTKGNNKVEDPYVPMVAPLVDWVYTIDDGLVATPGAPKAIAEKYREDCLAYTG